MAGSLERLEVHDFRCLLSAQFEPAAGINLILGENASGKTSLLEAIFVLGRGRSFRTGQRSRLVRDEASEFLILGDVVQPNRVVRLGVRGNRQAPLEAHVAGEPVRTLATLSETLPVEIVDPEIHKLVDEGPERRRRYLDWGTFHVEPRFLDVWSRYRKALRQRNALLQQAAPVAELEPWERELADSGQSMTRMRETFLAAVVEPLRHYSRMLLDGEARIAFRRGWQADTDLAAALARNRPREQGLGRTVAGPHRAELVLELDAARARSRVSRGQQKLLAASLVLAQLAVLAAAGKQRPVLLLDDPAAELDKVHVARLLAAVQQLDSQLFITALHRSNLPDIAQRTFHMEQFEPRLML